MADKLKQEVAENALAVQAGRDVNVGMSYTEVKDLVITLFENNFPKLKEIAQNAAIENVQLFTSEFEKKLVDNITCVDVNKFKEPDIQFSLNDAVQASARKGNKVDIDILAELVTERIRMDSNDLLSITCGEAISVMDKITSEQISYLTLCHFTDKMTVLNASKVENLEPISKIIYPLIANCFNISDASVRYLEFVGVLSLMPIGLGENRYYEIIKERYEFLKEVEVEDLKRQIEQTAPTHNKIIEHYKKLSVAQITLTPIGELIALANIKRVLPNVDYKVWIN